DVQPMTTKIENLDGTPVASDKKEDPLKNPAAYSKTPAELAGATMPKTDMPKADMSKTDMPATDISKASAPLVPSGKVPLGAGSVLQAGDPRYVPVPIVTLPDTNRIRAPPAAELPQAPQPNQPYMVNAFNHGVMPAPPPVAMREVSGNAFGANPYAGAMANGAFHQGVPNASGSMAPGFV